MNTNIRNSTLALLMGLAVVQGAVAAPEFYGPRSTIPAVPPATPKAQCGKVFEQSWTAGPRPRYVVVKDLAPCPTGKQPIRWDGPRGTIPIYEQN